MARRSVPPQTGLDEVERALSVLEGRHPEHERTKRETLAAAATRRKALDAELEESARRKRRRRLVIAANAVALIVAGAVAWRLATRAAAIRDALTRQEGPFLAKGMAEIVSNQLTAGSSIEAAVPEGSCVVALSTGGKVRVTSGGASFDGGRSVGFCTCKAGSVRVEAAGATGDATGLAVLRIDGAEVGGPLARAWSPFRPEVWGDSGAECAPAMLDAWLGRQPAPLPPSADAAGGPERAALTAAGFRHVADVAPGDPLGWIDVSAGDCLVANAGAEPLALRASGGDRPIEHAKGVLATCSSTATRLTVWREGPGRGPISVWLAAGKRIGGLLGARECARDAGWTLAPEAAWIAEGDRSWDAAAILEASTVKNVRTSAVPTEPAGPDVRLVAVVHPASLALTWDPPSNVAACDPGPGERGTSESVCALSAATALWHRGEGTAIAARGDLPLWLAPLSPHHETDAVAHVPELLALARHLVRQGFEPTLLEGVTELADGVRIAGRAGEDAVVAVGLEPKAPWVHPYTDGPAWDLGDAPRILPLAPGATLVLKATPRATAPVDARRTVVFRHARR